MRKTLQDLEKILQGKQGNLSAIEDGECLIHFWLFFELEGDGDGGKENEKWLRKG